LRGPYFPTLFQGALAQSVRALPCHGRGCGFEPRRLRVLFFCRNHLCKLVNKGSPVGFLLLPNLQLSAIFARNVSCLVLLLSMGAATSLPRFGVLGYRGTETRQGHSTLWAREGTLPHRRRRFTGAAPGPLSGRLLPRQASGRFPIAEKRPDFAVSHRQRACRRKSFPRRR
jgi:hypothetical protein